MSYLISPLCLFIIIFNLIIKSLSFKNVVFDRFKHSAAWMFFFFSVIPVFVSEPPSDLPKKSILDESISSIFNGNNLATGSGFNVVTNDILILHLLE